MKHTLGPWYVERSLMQRVLSDKGCVCVPHMHDNIGALESSANARLIAASPDLLKALIDLVSEYEDYTDADIDYEISQGNQMIVPFKRARAAIAKATGE